MHFNPKENSGIISWYPFYKIVFLQNRLLMWFFIFYLCSKSMTCSHICCNYLESIFFIQKIKLIFYFLFVKDSEEFNAHYDELSQLNIWKLILDVDKAAPFIFENLIPDILELPNLKANLEELEINSRYKIYVKYFIKSWDKYGEYAKLNQVTFRCVKFKFKDIFEFKKKMVKHFSEFRRYGCSFISSFKNPPKMQKSANKHKSR